MTQDLLPFHPAPELEVVTEAVSALEPIPGLEPIGPDAPAVPSFLFARHPRARRYVVRVRRDGTVRITIPRWGTKREAQAFADAQRPWIAEQMARLLREQPNLSPQLSEDDERTLQHRARRELPDRLRALAADHGLSVSRISIRNQRWRWGSCSRDGHICLNWRLVAMPDWVRDYVLLHELMHLKRMDHSPRFWKLVARVCPTFKEARAWLREHQSLLDPRG